MGIIWDNEKEQKLLLERSIDIREVAELIVSGDYIDILENSSRPEQQIFVIRYRQYIHVVPFVVDGDMIILKTVFPSRKFNQLYGKNNENT